MIVDVHSHFLPAAAIAAARARRMWREHKLELGSGDRLSITRNGRTYQWGSRYWASAAERVAHMDQRRIDMEVISLTGPLFGYRLSARQGAGLAREANDELTSFVTAAPTRFRGLATLPLQDPKTAAAELERALGNPLIVGAVVGGTIPDRPWDHPSLTPVLEVAANKKAFLFVHPTPMEPNLESFRHGLGSLIGQPVEMTVAWSDFVFGGVLDRYPDLAVCFAQAGGTVSFLSGRFVRGARPEGSGGGLVPSDYLSRVFYDSLTYSAASLRLLIDVVGPDRVLLGSDFPSYQSAQDPVGWVDSCDALSDPEKRAILGENAARVLGLAREPDLLST
jgi:aminocarboxymuconate-semialdehyde decarboxylase